MPLPTIAQLGAFAQTPAGQALLGGLGQAAPQAAGWALGKVGSGLGGATNWGLRQAGLGNYQNFWQGTPQSQGFSPSQQAQAYLLQQLQNPGGYGSQFFSPIEDEIKRQYNEEILPGLKEQFSPAQQRSAAYGTAFARSGVDLASRLAAMRAQSQQQQTSQLLPILAQYLSKQQELGLGQMGLGQKQQQQALGALGDIGQFGTRASQGDLQRTTQGSQSSLQALNQANTGQFTPIVQPGQEGGLDQLLNIAANAAAGGRR